MNPLEIPDNTESSFWAGISTRKPGVYTIRRLLTEEEKGKIPSPSISYIYPTEDGENMTIIRTFASAEEAYQAIVDPSGEKRAKEQLHEGIATIIESGRPKDK